MAILTSSSTQSLKKGNIERVIATDDGLIIYDNLGNEIFNINKNSGDFLNLFGGHNLMESTKTGTTKILRLQNNFIIQSGRFTGGFYAPTITFPIAFAARPQLSVTIETSVNHMAGFTNLTNSSFRGRQRGAGGETLGDNFDWLAIGYI